MTEDQKEVIRDYDYLAAECGKILNEQYSDDLDALFKLGGSSGGARPKILTQYDGEDWIVKFPSSYDSRQIGEEEYRYSQCAKKCGIEMPETRLFPSQIGPGYFGVKRFDRDREAGKVIRHHMLSASALLNTDFRIPALDYNMLMKLTLLLTDDYGEVWKMFRLMCFNVFAHNRDDHARNFSWYYDGKTGRWRLTPAYDLTYSHSAFGQHATTVDGNGVDPGIKELLAVAEKSGLDRKQASGIAQEIRENARVLLKELGRE